MHLFVVLIDLLVVHVRTSAHLTCLLEMPGMLYVLSIYSEVLGIPQEAYEHQAKSWTLSLQGSKQDLLENYSWFVQGFYHL